LVSPKPLLIKAQEIVGSFLSGKIKEEEQWRH
jgi:hypothetical protein